MVKINNRRTDFLSVLMSFTSKTEAGTGFLGGRGIHKQEKFKTKLFYSSEGKKLNQGEVKIIKEEKTWGGSTGGNVFFLNNHIFL